MENGIQGKEKGKEKWEIYRFLILWEKINSFKNYVFNTYYVLGTVLDSGIQQCRGQT